MERTFKVKFSKILIIMLYVSVLLFAGGIALCIMQAVRNAEADKLNETIYILLGILCVVLLSLSVSVLIYSKYRIKGSELILNLGYIKTAYNIMEMVEINHFKKTDKLVIYFKDYKYTVIITDKSEYDKIISEIRKINGKITYDEKIENEDIAK